MIRRSARPWLSAATLLLIGAAAAAQPISRGKLLYETHCIACHDLQVHWQEQRAASDWPKLVAEVRRWQSRARLQWSEPDILDVARHLNDTIYRHPQTNNVISQRSRPAPEPVARRTPAGQRP